MRLEKKMEVETNDSFEERFQKHFAERDEYAIYKDIEFACSNLVKKFTQHHYRADFQDLVDKATISQYTRLKNKLKKDPNFKIDKLVTWLYLGVYFVVKNGSQALIDKAIPIDSLKNVAACATDDVTDVKSFYDEIKASMSCCNSFTLKKPLWFVLNEKVEHDGWTIFEKEGVLNFVRNVVRTDSTV